MAAQHRIWVNWFKLAHKGQSLGALLKLMKSNKLSNGKRATPLAIVGGFVKLIKVKGKKGKKEVWNKLVFTKLFNKEV